MVGVEVIAGQPWPGEEGALAVLGQVADVPLEEHTGVPLQEVGVGDAAVQHSVSPEVVVLVLLGADVLPVLEVLDSVLKHLGVVLLQVPHVLPSPPGPEHLDSELGPHLEDVV